MKALNVGLIGCGGFAWAMYIPVLKRNPRYRIYATMDIIGDAARAAAEDTKAAYWTDDVKRVFSDSNVDVVIITTRHDSHEDLAIKAADSGKNILCEKPMALDLEGCMAVAEAVKRNNVIYTIGYNRGLAPMITKAKELLETLPGKKKMIYHRMQSPFPESHWTHITEIGGGRFIGEGCHIFDLFCELVQTEPIEVYASGGTYLDPGKVSIPDSGIVTLTFADGSMAAALINSAGCPDFPKEATEIYCDGKAIYISGFKKMEYYGFEGQKRIDLEYYAEDKGHAVEIDMLADSIHYGTPSPNGLLKAARAAVISFKVNTSIRTGRSVGIAKSEYNFE